jgi:hypothetical protein
MFHFLCPLLNDVPLCFFMDGTMAVCIVAKGFSSAKCPGAL